jgi:hypothetical protein
MTVENHQHRKTSTGMSRRDLLRAGLWGTVGWAGWSVGTGSRTLAINPAPAHAGEQPRAGGTLAMWTQGDPPNFDLHQNSAFVVNWPMAPCYNQLGNSIRWIRRRSFPTWRSAGKWPLTGKPIPSRCIRE